MVFVLETKVNLFFSFQAHSHEDLPSPQSTQEQQIQELQLIRQLQQQDSKQGSSSNSLHPGQPHALQIRQADIAAASSAGSASTGASIGHRPLSRAHSSPVVGKQKMLKISRWYCMLMFSDILPL